ncbi:flagellar assembly protein FliH [Salinibacillus kushneri]|uniref:Flagellar assembly protein FliH n=1 Tax=Salinibacillus kushneri TaxID=237682 RepID=A0A1I0EAX2_9BACI|nr:flagellar assembly protein FliH [Salinibacillus kushneri]
MILLSNIYKIKSSGTPEKSKTISVKPLKPFETAGFEQSEEAITNSMQKQQEKLLMDAEQKLENAKAEAEQIMEQAKAKIQKEHEKWQFEKESLYKELKESAYHDGFQEGKQKAEHEFQSYIDEACSLIRLAKKEYADIVDQSSADILKMAIKASEKIIGFTLEHQVDAFPSLVKQAMLAEKDAMHIYIYVHACEYENLLQYKEELQNMLSNQAELTIYPSHEMDQYGCIIDTPHGQIDAGIGVQLNVIKQKLLDLLEEDQVSENR